MGSSLKGVDNSWGRRTSLIELAFSHVLLKLGSLVNEVESIAVAIIGNDPIKVEGSIERIREHLFREGP